MNTRAFTLIELLVTIVIVVILAALILPTLGSMRQASQRAACASNLRQIGAAMLGYAIENGNTLPGPLYSGCKNTYESNHLGNIVDSPTYGSLIAKLAPYLDLIPPAPSQTLRSEVFTCPAWLDTVANPKGTPYRVVWEIELGENTKVQPFGYPRTSEPIKIDHIPSPARTPALYDLDQAVAGGGTNLNIPPKPVHGSTRNTLFFDGHVKAVSVQ